jgi:hypothetical protein
MRTLPLALLLAACAADGGLTKFNAEPAAAILSPEDGATLEEGETLSLRGSVSDPDHDTDDLQATWFVDGAPLCEAAPPDDAGISQCAWTVPADSGVELRLEVVDPGGARGSDALGLGILANEAPQVSLQGPPAGRLYAGLPLALSGTVIDPEDESLSLTWRVDGATVSGPAAPEDDGTVEGTFLLAEGEHEVSLRARDPGGHEGADTVWLVVGPANTAPACLIEAPLDGEVGETGALVTLMGTVSDADQSPDSLTVSWSSDRDGALGDSLADSAGLVSLFTADLSVGTHTLALRVEDEVGETCVSTLRYTVDTPPEISLEAPLSGAVINEGEALSLLAWVTDAEDASADLWVTWTSDADGLLFEGEADAAGQSAVEALGLSGGAHRLHAVVTDLAGLSAEATVDVVVNRIPGAPGLVIGPAAPQSGMGLTCTVATAALDGDGDPLTYGFSWTVDGAPFLGATHGALDSLVPGASVRGGQVWRCEAAASDAGSTGAVAFATVTIADDLDLDGWGEADGDCDDSDPDINPGEAEVCGDGIDNDCDASTGDGGTTEVCNGVDDDCDGQIDEVSGYITTQAEADALVDCTELPGLYVHVSAGVITVDLPVLERIDGPLYLHAASGITTLSLPALTEVTRYVYLYHNPALTTVDLGALTTVGGYVYVDGNTALSSVDLSALTTIGEYLYVVGNSAWCVPAATLGAIPTTGTTVSGNLCN